MYLHVSNDDLQDLVDHRDYGAPIHQLFARVLLQIVSAAEQEEDYQQEGAGMNLLGEHVRTWQGCVRCPISDVCTQPALYRGDDPPLDILFIGEAPGPQEDEQGEPFVGASGKLLDRMICEASNKTKTVAFHGFTNVVGCFPNVNGKIRQPTVAEVSKCWDRLKDCIEAAQPKSIVFVGKLSGRNTSGIIQATFPDIRIESIVHPARLLRLDRKGVEYSESMKVLERVHENYSSCGA